MWNASRAAVFSPMPGSLAELLDEPRDGRREHPSASEQPGRQRQAAGDPRQIGLGQLARARSSARLTAPTARSSIIFLSPDDRRRRWSATAPRRVPLTVQRQRPPPVSPSTVLRASSSRTRATSLWIRWAVSSSPLRSGSTWLGLDLLERGAEHVLRAPDRPGAGGPPSRGACGRRRRRRPRRRPRTGAATAARAPTVIADLQRAGPASPTRRARSRRAPSRPDRRRACSANASVSAAGRAARPPRRGRAARRAAAAWPRTRPVTRRQSSADGSPDAGRRPTPPRRGRRRRGLRSSPAPAAAPRRRRRRRRRRLGAAVADGRRRTGVDRSPPGPTAARSRRRRRGARGRPPRSRPSSSSSRCSRSPSGTIGSAAHRSSAAISNSRRGVGSRDASSTARAQRSNSTGTSPGRAPGPRAPAPPRSPRRWRRPDRASVDPLDSVPAPRPPDRAGSRGTTARARPGRRRDRPPARTSRSAAAASRSSTAPGQLDQQPPVGDRPARRPRPPRSALGRRRRRSPDRAATARRAPSPAAWRAISRTASGVGLDLLGLQDLRRGASVSRAVEISLKSKRWQRDRIVTGILCTSVVANTNTTCGGGSSSVFSSALNECADSMWTSSMM